VQVVTLLLLVAALACLIVGLMISNTMWIVASLVGSVVAVLAIRAARRRAEGAAVRRSQSETELVRRTGAREEIAALAAEAAAERSAALTVPAAEPETAADVVAAPTLEPAGRPKRVARVPGLGTDVAAEAVPADLVVSQPTTDELAVGDDDPVDEPAPANTIAPLIDKSHENVWVIDGRPRYHLSSCGFLVGQESESIPLQQAVEDGFSPCSRCDPDTVLASA
jgi:hypothetical protein